MGQGLPRQHPHHCPRPPGQLPRLLQLAVPPASTPGTKAHARKQQTPNSWTISSPSDHRQSRPRQTRNATYSKNRTQAHFPTVRQTTARQLLFARPWTKGTGTTGNFATTTYTDHGATPRQNRTSPEFKDWLKETNHRLANMLPLELHAEKQRALTWSHHHNPKTPPAQTP